MNIVTIVTVGGLVILCLLLNVLNEWLSRREYTKLRESMEVDLAEAVFLNVEECEFLLNLIEETHKPKECDKVLMGVRQKLAISIKYQKPKGE